MQKETTLVVLAAGMGSRYGGLKQLDPVGPNGEAILDYSVYDAMRAGFDHIVFIIRHDFEDVFKEQVAKKYEGKVDVKFAFQDLEDLPAGFTCPEGRTKPWGTTHALLAAKGIINTPFCILNADDFYGRQAYVTAHDYLVSDECGRGADGKRTYGMVGFKLANTLSENGSVTRGICQVDSNGFLTGIKETQNIFKNGSGAQVRPDDGEPYDLSGEESASMNMWAFSQGAVAEFDERFNTWIKDNVNVEKSECFIPTCIDELIKLDRANVRVIQTDSQWFGVTYKEDKPGVVASIQKLIDAGEYPEKLFA